MENIKKIQLAELIDVANKYITGEWSQEKMTEYGQTLVIREYIPLQEKVTISLSLMVDMMVVNSGLKEDRIGEFYKNLFFKVLLEGYAMIDCSDSTLLTYNNYDLLYPIFAPFIIQYCKFDYDTMCEYVHDVINFYNISDLLDGLANVDYESLEKAAEDNKATIAELNRNKELVEKLNQIMATNDPTTKVIVDKIKELSLEESKNK